MKRMIAALFFLSPVFLFHGNCPAGSENSPVLTISEGLRMAVENNRLIKLSAHDIRISSEDVSIARSKLLPSVNASVSQTLLTNQPGAVFGAQTVRTAERSSFSYGINAYQTVYDFGSSKSQYDSSIVILDSKKLNMELTKNLVALSFITAYLDTLETEKLIVVAQKEAERLESHSNVARNLFQEGVITKNDVLQAEVKLSDSRQRLLTLKNLRALNASRINSILARPLSSDIRLEEAPAAGHAIEALDLESTWATAEKQRLELGIIARELEAIDLEVASKKTEFLPKFFAQGGYNYTENRFLLHEDNWSFILGMNVNLFSGGSSRAGLSKARYVKEQLLEQKNKLGDDIRLEVEKNYLDMKNADEKIRVTKDAVGQAEENMRINKVRYEEGLGTATDVLDAITLLTTAETNYHRAVYELKRAQAGLMYAMGMELVSTYK